VVNPIESHAGLKKDRIKVKVENRWIMLEDTVDWYYQRKIAEDAVENLADIKGGNNHITDKPKREVCEIQGLLWLDRL
jgi:osmotically-inducible protein OsmY